MARSYLIHFYSEIDWIDFRYLEFDALLELNHLNPSSVYNIDQRHQHFLNNDPFLFIHSISEEQILKICQRSVLIKNIYELWGGEFLGPPSLLTTHLSFRGSRS
jgi:tRNA G10  N-methylase Trm11